MVEFFSHVSLPPDQRDPISCESYMDTYFFDIDLIFLFFVEKLVGGLYLHVYVCIFFI